ncbi:MAG: hypothetical protein OEV43_00425 [Coriobacteriia bacterium]|nr:hypothetical protein [Coriobacteriia bacterium]
MRLPFDVRDVVKSGSQINKLREEPVRLAVFVEADAPDSLVDVVQASFRPYTANARLQVEVTEPGVEFVVDSAVDAVVGVVGSGQMGLARQLEDPRERAIPTAVIALGEESSPIAEMLRHPYRDTLAHADPTVLVEDELGEWLVERVPDKRLALAHNYAFMRRAVALEAVKNTAWQNGAIGVVAFVPGTDMPLMTANQIKMLFQIAAAYGEPLGMERMRELVAIVGGGFVFRTIARQTAALIPGFGWAIKGGIGASGTLAVGYAAVKYFEGGADLGRLSEQFDRIKHSLTERFASDAEERAAGDD